MPRCAVAPFSSATKSGTKKIKIHNCQSIKVFVQCTARKILWQAGKERRKLRVKRECGVNE